MKAISIIQPWASLAAIGAKFYETRSWPTNYRGPLAIHASKGYPSWAQEIAASAPFRSALALAGLHPLHLPRGVILATCRLTDCIPTREAFSLEREIADPPVCEVIEARIDGMPVRCPVTPTERTFGDWSPGRFAWRLAEVSPLPEPVPARGSLGLWEWRKD